ncbi:MAG: hypothetical protein A2Y07_04300 [Planctomycetes bacterium GWF2_50_10]|nr:MAG: hypothetical protein A2Y07_04300 [Planctomycetes bacterium GWF2_50_10]
MGPVGLKKTVTDANGIAQFKMLAPKTYTISITDGTSKEDVKKGKLPRWAPVNEKVVIKAGETTKSQVRLSTGGVIEVTVLDGKKAPVKETLVYAHNPTGGFSGASGYTDANGIARLRVLPGSYQVQMQNARLSEQVEVEQGQTAKLTLEGKNPVKITGIARDGQGKPVAGAKMSLPYYGWTAETDAQGQFTLDTSSFGPMRNEAQVLVVRHEERNLAAIIDVDEDVNQMEVKLENGIIARGIVNDVNDKPIQGATLNVTVWNSSRGWSLNNGVKTDANGHYNIKALVPDRKYSFNATADGYGQGYSNNIEAGEAENSVIEVEPITLKLATLTVSGIVVDENDKPVEGVNIQCYGQGQVNIQTKSDKQGNFTLAKVCEGELNLSAYMHAGTENLNAWLRTAAPVDEQLKLVLKKADNSGSSWNRESTVFKSLKGKKLPEFQGDIAGIDVNSIAGKKLVLCFFDMNQRPSRFAVRELTRLKTEIEAKEAAVILVQAASAQKDVVENWIKEQNVPFGAGIIQGDAEKVKAKLGVKGLPWIIVTDSSKKVIAEGVAPAQVIDTIK